MRSMLSHILIQCRYVTLVLGLLVLLTPPHGLAQEATPPATESIPLTGVPAEPIETQTEPAPTGVGTDPNAESAIPEPTEPLASESVTAADTDGTEPATTDPDVAEIAPLESDPGGTGTPAPENDGNVQEPVVWTNTDTITLADEITNFTLAPGAGQSISMVYAVTTPRQGTSVQAALVDDSGSTPVGWLLSTSRMSDVSALEPGTTFTTTFTVTAPDAPEVAQTVSLQIWSETTSDRGLEAGIGQQVIATITGAVPVSPLPTTVVPDVTVAPLDFGVLTWDGDSWGAAEATTTMTITRDGDGDRGTYDIQVELTGDVPGFRPVLTGASTLNDSITLLATSGDPNAGPFSVARVSGDFTGTAELVLVFTLTPNDDAPVGTHQLDMNVTTMPAP